MEAHTRSLQVASAARLIQKAFFFAFYSAYNRCAISAIEMASSRYFRRKAVSTDRNSLSFDRCSVHSRTCLVYYEKVATRDKSDAKCALDLFGFLDGEAFEFYYDTFALDGELMAEASGYSVVRAVLLKRFGSSKDPAEHIRKAVSSSLDYKHLVGLLKYIYACFEKAGFNKIAKFSLLQNVFMEFGDLA